MKISLQAKEPQDLLYFIITVPDHCHPSIRNFSAGKPLVCRSSGVSQDPRPLGHTRIKTTQRYCKVSLKVQRDYFRAVEVVVPRTAEESNFT